MGLPIYPDIFPLAKNSFFVDDVVMINNSGVWKVIERVVEQDSEDIPRRLQLRCIWSNFHSKGHTGYIDASSPALSLLPKLEDYL